MAGPGLLSSKAGRGQGSARVLSAEPLAAALVFFSPWRASSVRNSGGARDFCTSPDTLPGAPPPLSLGSGCQERRCAGQLGRGVGGEQGRAARELLIGQASEGGRWAQPVVGPRGCAPARASGRQGPPACGC